MPSSPNLWTIWGVLAVASGIGDHPHANTEVGEIQRRLQAEIVAHGEDRGLSGAHPPGVGKTPGRVRLYDAGSVVVCEDQWPLDRSGRHHHALCPTLPVPLTDPFSLASSLETREQVLAPDPGHGRRSESADPGVRFDTLREAACALVERKALVLPHPPVEMAAEPRAALEERDSHAGARSGERGGHPGRAPAHHGDLGIEVELRSLHGAAGRRDVQDAQARQGAHAVLKERPSPGRTVKEMVVEAGRHPSIEAIKEAPEIELGVSAHVLSPDRHPFPGGAPCLRTGSVCRRL